MKRIYLLLFCFAFSISLFAGNGSKESPYSVSELKAKKVSSNDKYYVECYVVGEFEANSNNKLFYEMSPWSYNYYEKPEFGGYVYIVADDPHEYDINKCLVIQFPTTDTFDDYGLDMHPEYWRKKFMFYGTHETYNGLDGLKKISEYELLSSNLEDESDLWNFTDDFEKGTTTAPKNGDSYEYTNISLFDNDDKWKGCYFTHVFSFGIYLSGELTVTQYKITNGAVDEGKPKWDDRAVCLRGENATIEQIAEYNTGLGEIEFWAGNYENYSSYKMSFTLQVSTDFGKTWNDVATDVPVPVPAKATTNGMTLFRYEINKPGSTLFRIIKTDGNVGKGLQIDNIKFSRYKAPTSLPNIKNEELYVSVKNGGVELTNENSGKLSIYSITGQEIYSDYFGYSSKTFIPLNSGLYIVRFNQSAKKIIVR